MTTVIANTIDQVRTKNIIELNLHMPEGIATFCGVLAKDDNELFFPFFCIDAAVEYTFEPDARLEFDSEYSYAFIEKRSNQELRELFAKHQAFAPNHVANHEIFEAMTN